MEEMSSFTTSGKSNRYKRVALLSPNCKRPMTVELLVDGTKRTGTGEGTPEGLVRAVLAAAELASITATVSCRTNAQDIEEATCFLTHQGRMYCGVANGHHPFQTMFDAIVDALNHTTNQEEAAA